jgi:glycosyltransferase involved in cell wall biosynthesis
MCNFIVSIIVPCYNEQEVLPYTAEKLSGVLQQLISEQIIDEKSTLLFVDDGSSDNTWSLIEKFHAESPLVFNGIKLSGNSGYQNAFLCGIVGEYIGKIYLEIKRRPRFYVEQFLSKWNKT